MALVDTYGRSIEYVRLSVTDRCDLRCDYCLPPAFKDFEVPEHWLTFEEIARMIAAFARLGTRRVRITGGEPLVRKHLPQLAGRLAALPGIEDLSMSTNATRLSRLAEPLNKAGIRRLNVSLDSLDPERYRSITGGGKLDKVLQGLDAAKRAGFEPIKINMVVMKNRNLDEVDDMVAFCLKQRFTLRFIEPMPIGGPGQAASRDWISLQDVRRQLEQRYDLLPAVMNHGGPARYVRVAGTSLNIGFITPISQHFCETCNRVRLAVDGTLYLCLGQNDSVNFRPLLREGISDPDLEQAIREAIALKPERHYFREQPEHIVRFMARTGG